MTLKCKVAVVTGGGQGLGRAIALALAKEGAKVIIIGRTEKTLKQVDEEIKNIGGEAKYLIADITNPNNLKKLDPIIAGPGVDVLVNNAGWSPPLKNIEDLSDNEVADCFGANVFSIFYLLKKIIPYFKKYNKGIIVNISSRAGKKGYPRLSPYSASKFAVEGLTQAVAKELEKTDIKCYSVAPGPLNTPMRQQLLGDAAEKEDPALTAGVIIKLIRGDLNVPSGTSIDPELFK